MKNLLLSTAIVGVLAGTPALADPTVMLGLSYSFGGAQDGKLGISGRVLSSNQRDEVVGALGVTYFPGANSWGVDAGIGYNFSNESLLLTYDFMNQGVQLSAGWADLEAPEDLLTSS